MTGTTAGWQIGVKLMISGSEEQTVWTKPDFFFFYAACGMSEGMTPLLQAE